MKIKEKILLSYVREFENENLKDFDVDKFFKSLDEVSGLFFNQDLSDDTLQPEFELLKTIHFRNNLLWLNIHETFDFKNCNLQDITNSLFFDYANILAITQNNIQAIFDLCYKGFDYQALSILRNHLELFELKLCMFGDVESYVLYKKVLPENKDGKFTRSMKFSTTSNTANKILQKLIKKPGYEIYQSLYADLINIKKELYTNLSETLHPNRTSITLNAYVFHPHRDEFLINMGGRRSAVTQRILKYTIFLEVVFYRFILIHQIEDYKMHFSKYGSDASTLAFCVIAIDDIFKSTIVGS